MQIIIRTIFYVVEHVLNILSNDEL